MKTLMISIALLAFISAGYTAESKDNSNFSKSDSIRCSTNNNYFLQIQKNGSVSAQNDTALFDENGTYQIKNSSKDTFNIKFKNSNNAELSFYSIFPGTQTLNFSNSIIKLKFDWNGKINIYFFKGNGKKVVSSTVRFFRLNNANSSPPKTIIKIPCYAYFDALRLVSPFDSIKDSTIKQHILINYTGASDWVNCKKCLMNNNDSILLNSAEVIDRIDKYILDSMVIYKNIKDSILALSAATDINILNHVIDSLVHIRMCVLHLQDSVKIVENIKAQLKDSIKSSNKTYDPSKYGPIIDRLAYVRDSALHIRDSSIQALETLRYKKNHPDKSLYDERINPNPSNVSPEGMDVTNIVDGMAKFLVNRTKQELAITFFKQLQRKTC